MHRLKEHGIENEQDFFKALEEIDREMKDSDIPIPARQLQGWLRFSRKFSLGLSSFDPLSDKVMDWFKTIYGNRLNVRFNNIDTVVSVRGDFYRMTIPKIWGSFRVICDPRTVGVYTGTQIAKDEKDPLPVTNVLDCIKDLTIDYAITFSIEELKNLTDTFITSFSAINYINEVKNIDFIEEARADMIESVNHLIAQKPQYGSSQWSSLQATEKFIKAYIKKQIGELPNKSQHHNLEKLANKAETLGLKLSSRDELSKIQCSASVRYDSSLVKPSASLDAHYAAIKICSEISQYLIPSEKKGKLELSINWIDTILEAGKFYTHRETKENLFCEGINGNIAHLFLVESYFQGSLIQAEFNQDTKYQKQYKEILDTNEIERLRKMYEQLQ